jgi:hypothetical protein
MMLEIRQCTFAVTHKKAERSRFTLSPVTKEIQIEGAQDFVRAYFNNDHGVAYN